MPLTEAVGRFYLFRRLGEGGGGGLVLLTTIVAAVLLIRFWPQISSWIEDRFRR